MKKDVKIIWGLLLAIGVLVSYVQYSHAAITVNQTCQNTKFSTAATCVLSSVPAGDVLVAETFTNSSAAFTLTGCGVTWTQVINAQLADKVYGYVALDSGGGACTVSSSYTGGATDIGVDVWDLSGATATVDGTSTQNANFCTSACATKAITTIVNGDAILAGIFGNNTSNVYSSISYTTDFNGTPSGGTYPTLAAHLIQSTAGSTSMTYVASQSTSNDQIMIAIKASASGSTGASNALSNSFASLGKGILNVSNTTLQVKNAALNVQ